MTDERQINLKYYLNMMVAEGCFVQEVADHIINQYNSETEINKLNIHADVVSQAGRLISNVKNIRESYEVFQDISMQTIIESYQEFNRQANQAQQNAMMEERLINLTQTRQNRREVLGLEDLIRPNYSSVPVSSNESTYRPTTFPHSSGQASSAPHPTNLKSVNNDSRNLNQGNSLVQNQPFTQQLPLNLPPIASTPQSPHPGINRNYRSVTPQIPANANVASTVLPSVNIPNLPLPVQSNANGLPIQPHRPTLSKPDLSAFVRPNNPNP